MKSIRQSLICATFLALVFSTTEVASVKKCLWDKSINSTNECFKQVLQEILEKNRYGQQFGEIPLEPFELSEFHFTSAGPVLGVEVNLINIKIYGYTLSTVVEVRNNVNGLTFVITTLSPLVRIISEYEISGRILDSPIFGKGPCKGIFENLTTIHRLKLDKYENEGKKYLKLSNYSLELHSENVVPVMDNLYDNHPHYAPTMKLNIIDNGNSLFNACKKEFADGMAPLIKEKLNAIVFAKIPFNDIFYEEI